MICTNVQGSPVPLYAVGRRMLSSYPQVPTGYDLGIGCAVQSYNGRLCFGLIADAHAGADVNRLRDYLYKAFEELRRAVGAKKPRRKAAPSRPQSRSREPVEPVRVESSEPSPAATASPYGVQQNPEAMSPVVEAPPEAVPGAPVMILGKAAA
jgi:hypothetical protein